MTDRTRIDLRCVPGFALAIAIVFVIPVSLRFRGTAPGGGHVHLLIACAVVALGLAVLPATAGAASITVTPNTGLNYFGQDVNVTGTGWEGQPEGYVGPVEFRECIEGTNTCGLSEAGRQGARVDGNGNFSATFHATTRPGGVFYPGSPPPFSCRERGPDPCEVMAEQFQVGG